MQNVNTLLKHVAMEKGIKLYSPHIYETKAEMHVRFSSVLAFCVHFRPVIGTIFNIQQDLGSKIKQHGF